MFERPIGGFFLAGLAWLAAALPAVAGEPAITDPTLPPGIDTAVVDPTAGPGLRLQSTRISAASRSAMINGQIVTPGSMVGGAKVLSIDPGRVTLQRGTEQIMLQMPAPQVKRPANGEDA